jgi:hypothetical protein
MNRCCVFSLVLILFSSDFAMAANQVVFAGSPTTAPGSVTAIGSYVLDMGWTWSGVARTAFPVIGGEPKSVLGAAKPMNMWGRLPSMGCPLAPMP